MGRIAEIMAEQGSGPIEQVHWMKVKYGLGYSLERISNRNIRQDEIFDLLLEALPWSGFARFLAELLEFQLIRHGKMQYYDSETTRHWLFKERTTEVLGKAVEVLGYEFTIGVNSLGETSLVVLPTVGQRKHGETGKLRSILGEKHSNALESLQGAYEAYVSGRTDGNRQAIESARNALEKVVRNLSEKDLGAGIQEISSDNEKRKKMLQGIRDYLSVQGTHADQSPSDADTLMAIRLVEDILVWILQSRHEW